MSSLSPVLFSSSASFEGTVPPASTALPPPQWSLTRNPNDPEWPVERYLDVFYLGKFSPNFWVYAVCPHWTPTWHSLGCTPNTFTYATGAVRIYILLLMWRFPTRHFWCLHVLSIGLIRIPYQIQFVISSLKKWEVKNCYSKKNPPPCFSKLIPNCALIRGIPMLCSCYSISVWTPGTAVSRGDILQAPKIFSAIQETSTICLTTFLECVCTLCAGLGVGWWGGGIALMCPGE